MSDKNIKPRKRSFWQKTKWFVFSLLTVLCIPLFSQFFPWIMPVAGVAFIVFFIMGIVNLFRGNKNGKRKKR